VGEAEKTPAHEQRTVLSPLPKKRINDRMREKPGQASTARKSKRKEG
jgi:hypothetical protein